MKNKKTELIQEEFDDYSEFDRLDEAVRKLRMIIAIRIFVIGLIVWIKFWYHVGGGAGIVLLLVAAGFVGTLLPIVNVYREKYRQLKELEKD